MGFFGGGGGSFGGGNLGGSSGIGGFSSGGGFNLSDNPNGTLIDRSVPTYENIIKQIKAQLKSGQLDQATRDAIGGQLASDMIGDNIGRVPTLNQILEAATGTSSGKWGTLGAAFASGSGAMGSGDIGALLGKTMGYDPSSGTFTAKDAGNIFSKIGSGIDAITGQSGKAKTAAERKDTSYTVMQPASMAELLANYNIDNVYNRTHKAVGDPADSQKQANEMDAEFKKLLVATMANNGFANPEQIAKATEYVDATFTNPANAALQDSMKELQGSYDSRAASLGRQVDDTGYNRDIANEQAKQMANLQLQRGGLVQQRADELAFNRPMQQAQAGLVGSQYFSDRATKLFNNNIMLSDMANRRADQLFKQRQAEGIQVGTSNLNTSKYETPSMGNRIAAGANALIGGYNTLSKLGGEG